MPNTEEFKQHKKRQRHRKSERRQLALNKLLAKIPPLSKSPLIEAATTKTNDNEGCQDSDDTATIPLLTIDQVFRPIPPYSESAEFWSRVPSMCNPNAAVLEDSTSSLGEDGNRTVDIEGRRKFGQNQRRQAKMKRKLQARQARGDITKDEEVRLWNEHGRVHHNVDQTDFTTDVATTASGTPTTTISRSKVDAFDSSPSISLLSANRGQRKTWQVENFVSLLKDALIPGMTVVDFGSGSGNLCLALAAYFRDVRFVLVDKNEYSLQLVQARAHVSGLTNVQVQTHEFSWESLPNYRPPPPPSTSTSSTDTDTDNSAILHHHHQDQDDGKPSFDLGIGLHCCGSFTDMVMEVCRLQRADCIVCPCCSGGISATTRDDDNDDNNLCMGYYPRSTLLQSCLTAEEYVGQLSKSADNERVYRAKCWIEYDRALWAHEHGYAVKLWKLMPVECTPKHHVLYLKYKKRAANDD